VKQLRVMLQKSEPILLLQQLHATLRATVSRTDTRCNFQVACNVAPCVWAFRKSFKDLYYTDQYVKRFSEQVPHEINKICVKYNLSEFEEGLHIVLVIMKMPALECNKNTPKWSRMRRNSACKTHSQGFG